MSDVTPLPCPSCGKPVEVCEGNVAYPSITCPNCYDGAPDSPTRGWLVWGHTRKQTIENWNEFVEEFTPEPLPLLTRLRDLLKIWAEREDRAGREFGGYPEATADIMARGETWETAIAELTEIVDEVTEQRRAVVKDAIDKHGFTGEA